MRNFFKRQPAIKQQTQRSLFGSNVRVGVLDPTRPIRPRKALPLSPALRIQQAIQLQHRIQFYMDGSLKVSLTDNRAIMISVRRQTKHRCYDVRLHHLFVDAPENIIQYLASYIVFNDQNASIELGQFIEKNDHHIGPVLPIQEKKPQIRTQGRVFDLQEVFNKLNSKYFNSKVNAKITWGRRVRPNRPRHSIRMGSYTVEENLIRINPGLDQRWVPPFYLEWVVFHEMLHAFSPPQVINGRRQFHSPVFAGNEHQFEHYEQASTWERKNLPTLLCI